LILFVGKLARRHYIPNLLKAFAELKTDMRVPHRLVLVGPDYLQLNIPRRAHKLGVGDAVTHIPFVPHKDLPPLYNAAEFFVFPASHAEGFGIPVVEAMACGTPVITVNQGSLLEIAPGASIAVESSAVAHLREGMRAMMSDASLREALAAKGLRRAKQFSWQFTAERTMKTLWELAQRYQHSQDKFPIQGFRPGGLNSQRPLIKKTVP
jgi:glycosyltransferase involved in cell wall biosynthesis